MHPGEISEFQWERPLGSTTIYTTTFQVRTRPKARWGVWLGSSIWMKKDSRWNSVFFKLTIHVAGVLLLSTIIELSIQYICSNCRWPVVENPLSGLDYSLNILT
jgi:hypothetical protein